MTDLFYKERFIIASTISDSPADGWIDICWQDEFGQHSHIIRKPAVKPNSDKPAEDCLVELAKKWIDAQSKTSIKRLCLTP